MAGRNERPLFPERLEPDATGLVALGGTLSVPVLLEAYARGIFPWTGEDPIPWCAPDPRLVLVPSRFHASRSLEKLVRKGIYDVRLDTDFAGVIRACAAMPRPGQDGTWITPNMIACYEEMFERGIAHSVEVRAGGVLVGGLYGLTLGRAFFGESMFSARANASKAALFTLCCRLVERGFHFIDCQAVTPHLLTLGAEPIALAEYLSRLERALAFESIHSSWADW